MLKFGTRSHPDLALLVLCKYSFPHFSSPFFFLFFFFQSLGSNSFCAFMGTNDRRYETETDTEIGNEVLFFICMYHRPYETKTESETGNEVLPSFLHMQPF